MRIPLKVQGVTDVNSDHSFSLLIVTDENEERQINIMVDPIMRHEFALRRGKYVGKQEHIRQATEILSLTLPETISAVLKYLTNVELAVIIVGVFDGEYRAVLEDQRTGTSFPIRVSDGVLLSYADRHIPLYIEERLWLLQSTPYKGIQAQGIAMPLNTLSVGMLRAAMKKCIDEEQYEMAEQLKQELIRRHAPTDVLEDSDFTNYYDDDEE